MALVKLNIARGVTGTLSSANFSGGKIGQVVSTARATDTSTSSDSLVATGHIATLTPSATSSKILIILGIANAYVNSSNKDMRINFYSSIGGASYSDITGIGQVRDTVRTGFGGNHYLYSPNTTSSVAIQTYYSRVHSGTGTIYYINAYTGTNTNLTLMEVLA
tara:strand:+ start:41 stop:529 length:489 start_codon:yes stop_codon:yes gene_type:complete